MTGRRLKVLLVCALCFFNSALFLSEANASAASATDTLSFYVGYFGGPYYEKATFSWKELYDNLDLREEAYTYTNGERIAVQGAHGFYLRDLFDYADIDTGSIASMDFYTADQKAGAFASFTREALFDTPRYYFDDLAYKIKYDSDSLWNESYEVEPMLAIEDRWSWYDFGTENTAPSYSSMSTSNRFRLCFGQAFPQEAATNKSAKMVHTVYVTFFGSPEISARKQNLELKLGSNYTLKLDIDAADELIGNEIRKGVVWESDDNGVVTVDSGGKLTLISEGTVQITAISGDLKAVYNITVTADTDTETKTETNAGNIGISLQEGTLSGNSSENSVNDGVSGDVAAVNSDSENSNVNSDIGSDSENNISDIRQNETHEPSDTEKSFAERIDIETKSVVKSTETVKADEFMYKLDPGVLGKSFSLKGAVSVNKENSVAPLEMPAEENAYLPVTVISAVIFFFFGFLWGFIKYKKEI